MVELAPLLDSCDMSTCTCSSENLAAVTFGNGTVLLRCSAHEQHRWLVHGEPVDTAQALVGLRALFLQERDSSPRRQPRRSRVIQLPAALPFREPAAASRVDDASLNAVLRAHGLSGSWAVA